MDIRLSIFKHPDHTGKIIILLKGRLNITEISHMNFNIISILVAVCVDLASLRRQIHAGHLSRLF